MLSSVTFQDKARNLFCNVDLIWSFSVHLQLSNTGLPYCFQMACNFERKSMGTSLLCLEFLDLAHPFLQNQA